MGISQDTRIAARLLARNWAFTAMAAMALGLGIGVNSTFFSLVNAAVLRGLPIDAPDRVMSLGTRNAQGRRGGFSHDEFVDLRGSSRTLAPLASYRTAPMTVIDDGIPPDRIFGAYMTASGFEVLGVRPTFGRNLIPDDDRPGAGSVVVLGHALWQARYRGDPSVIGRSITLNGMPATVVGVMPHEFSFPGNTAAWLPLAALSALSTQPRDMRTLSVFGRLSPTATMTQAIAEVETRTAAWSTQFPAAYEQIRFTVEPINERFFGRVTDTMWLGFIAVGVLVLLIACANVANLLLMRAVGRRGEVAIRLSLGATRGRVIRQLLAEGVLLAACGAAVGVLLSYVGLGLLRAMVPAEVASLFELTLDRRVLSALMGSAIGSVLVFALAPAFHLSRSSIIGGLREGGRSSTARHRWTAAFLAAELALTLILLAHVGLGIRISRSAQQAEFEIDPAPLLTMSISLPDQPYDSPAMRNRLFDRLQESIAALPSVASVAVASVIPGGGGPLGNVMVAGRAPSAGSPEVVTVMVSERYFDTVGAPLIHGRSFTSLDGTPGHEVALVSQRFADLFFPNADPIGQLIRLPTSAAQSDSSPWLRIIGVSPSLRQSQRQRQLGGVEPDPAVYVPARAAGLTTASLLIRSAGDPAALTPSIREAARQIDPSLPVYEAMTMEQAMRQLQWNGRVSNALLFGVGAIALALALVGLYAMVAHGVSQRRKELGIRVALGARPAQVGAMILGSAMRHLILGLAIGIGGTFAFDRLFTTAAIRLTDLAVLGPTLAAMVLVAIASSLVPAMRAATLDPVLALRED